MNYAVISTDPGLRASVAEALDEGRQDAKLASTLAAPVGTLGRDVADDLRRASVQIVVLDLADDPALGLRFARFLSEELPGLTFVLVGPPDVDPGVLLEAMRVGASEYLKSPYEFAELGAALGRAGRRVGGAQPAETHEPGHVYAFYSAKGGSGVTTSAANFAVWLREATHQSTLLIDLDLELGGAAVVLGMQPRYSFADFVRNLSRMDRNLLDSLVDHHESGIDLLSSPTQLNGTDTLTKEQVRSAIHYLRRCYEHVVIDLARTVSPVTLAALERADDVVLLTNPDLPSLRNAKKVLPVLQRVVPGGREHIRVVLNRNDPAALIQSKDVREALGQDVYWTLSRDDEALLENANEGRPVVNKPKSKYTKDMQGLVRALGRNATNGKAPQGALGGLLRPFRRSGKE